MTYLPQVVQVMSDAYEIRRMGLRCTEARRLEPADVQKEVNLATTFVDLALAVLLGA